MRTRKVNRYYCDFCKKANCSKSAMEIHESHCTKNPERVCRFCLFMENGQAKMSDMLAIIGDSSQFHDEKTSECGFVSRTWNSDKLNSVLKLLRDATDSCPFCILSAFRQAGIPVPEVTDFNYAKERQSALDDMDASRREQDYRGVNY